METKTIRTLKAHEIDVRVQQVCGDDNTPGAILLLYKDARCDMAILDETFGMYGWQREHAFKDDKNYCKVSIWDDSKGMWISKEDVGVESNTEETKGEASDAFKRACFNIGIGRELYSAPFIFVKLASDEWYTDQKTGKKKAAKSLKFYVSQISYNESREIASITIKDHKGVERFKKIRGTIGADYLTDNKKQRLNKLFSWLEVAYRNNPEAFVVVNYLLSEGFVFDEEDTQIKILQKWTEYITNKGL